MKMKLSTTGLSVVLMTTCLCSALPPKDSKQRAIDPSLSKKDHDANGHHNSDYDHDAFLGEHEAEEFDDLSPEESKRRLGVIVDKIDKDKDGFVTEEELQHWIQYVQKRYVSEDTEKQWIQFKEDELDQGKMTWEAYRKRTFGYEEEPDEDGDYASMVKRDNLRFLAADRDGDKKLSKEEYADFLHPEEAEHMKDIVVRETLEDIDKDHDGFISLEEYIGDMWPNQNGEEPDWVQNEREQFSQFRDKNADGKMDKDEVKEWIIPENYDHSEAEAKHLIYEADQRNGDGDGKLSKEEILNNYDIFVGSQATDFGEALNRHDEF